MNLKDLQQYLKNHKHKHLLILDGDWLVFKSMSAAEIETEWEDDEWTLTCNHANARAFLNDEIDLLVTSRNRWKDACVVLAFSDKRNWRKELVTETYKANRKATRKPCGYKTFVERLFSGTDYLTVREERLEADDVMGIVGSKPHAFNVESCTIISIDKDFKTIPCEFLWCTNGILYQQTTETADFWHLYQTIKGDITDGYSGIKGWGEQAEDFLNNPYYLKRVNHTLQSGKNKGQTQVRWVKEDRMDRPLWDCILSIALKAEMTEEDVLQQARLARILRYDDYNMETGEIYLWEPA